MANSKLILTFIEELGSGDYIEFKRRMITDPIIIQTVRMTFRVVRNYAGEIAVVPSFGAGKEGWASANDYVYYMNIDYNSPPVYNLSRFEGVVTIESLSDEWEFFEFTDTSGFVSHVFDNYVPPTFGLINFAIQNSDTDVCNFVKIEVNANENIHELRLNETVYPLTPNTTQTIEVVRGVVHNLYMSDINDVEKPVFEGLIWDFLSVENTTISVVPSLAGGTVTVNVTPSANLSLEYSLNGTDWVTTNIFTGQVDGVDKTMYIRDQFGCQITKLYTVDDFGTRAPYLFLSKANSINFKKVEAWDNCSIHKNDDNTLAYEGLAYLNSCSEQKFNTCDTTTLQFKSNFETPTAVLREEDGTETAITITKRSSNLNRYSRMDCLFYAYDSLRTAIYYETGNHYDEFGAPTGTYTLQGNLPEFAVIGNVIDLEGLGTYEIKSTIYDEAKNKKVILIDRITLTGGETVGKTTARYDILPFEVYEMSIDWSSWGVGVYDIVITNTDTENGVIQHVSENIHILTEHDDTLHIRYYNTNNRDIFYKYGIEHQIRIPYLSHVGKQRQESSINIGDNRSSLVNSDVHDMDVITFDAVTKQVMRKLVIALSCEHVYINGVRYVKDGDIDEGNISNTNLYEVKATMLKTGENYNNNPDGVVGEDDYINFDIPPIITDGSGFIKA